MDKETNYNPFGKDVSQKIMRIWKSYKDTFGLEGDLYFRMLREGNTQAEIDRAIEEMRRAKKSLIDEFHSEINTND